MVKKPAKKVVIKKAVVKAKGKKPALKKILLKSPLPWEDDWDDDAGSKFLGPRTLWDITNDIEHELNRISNSRDIIELAAEKITLMPESGALWGVADMLRDLENRLDVLVQELLKYNKTVRVTP